MNVNLKPRISAILEAQVASGLFPTLEDAITAAVLGEAPSDPVDLAWAKPYLAQGDDDIAQGRTFGEADTFAEIEGLFEST